MGPAAPGEDTVQGPQAEPRADGCLCGSQGLHAAGWPALAISLLWAFGKSGMGFEWETLRSNGLSPDSEPKSFRMCPGNFLCLFNCKGFLGERALLFEYVDEYLGK